MPINTSAFVPSPDEPEDNTPEVVAEPPKRKRRTKEQMIAEAVIPGMDDMVEIKDAASGAKIERQWRVAVEMYREGKVEFPKDLEHAFKKYEQERASGAAPESTGVIADETHATDESGQMVAPAEAELGDEVVIDKDTYVVGHGNKLVQGMVSDNETGDPIIPKRRWQRELGAGPNGPWQSRQLSHQPAASEPTSNGAVADTPAKNTVTAIDARGGTAEWVDDKSIKIGTGVLEKIGMPQVEQFASASQMQIGPISISRTVYDDGRRDVVDLPGGRKGEVISSAVEGFDLLNNTTEFVAARFRGQLYDFLVSIGAVRQPVS